MDILLESVIGQFYKEEDIAEVNKFFGNKSDLGSVERGVKKGKSSGNCGRLLLRVQLLFLEAN